MERRAGRRRGPDPKRRSPSPEWQRSLRLGRQRARVVLDRRRRRARRRGVAAIRPGLLVAEGDSWFDYPFCDVLAELEDGFNYEVESVAHRGDSIEEMVYDPNQLEKLARKLERLKARDRRPKAVLLSGGGNDIAGEAFSVLLNHKRSGLPALNAQMLAGLLEQRLRAAMIELSSAVTVLCREAFGSALPILFHGYDYPIPDGRGYLGGFWVLPGPWLEPGFRRKGYEDLGERCAVMVALIDGFNELLADIAGGPGLEHVRHVDLRGSLSCELGGRAYRRWWGNELHPTERGFRTVAGRFHRALAAV